MLCVLHTPIVNVVGNDIVGTALLGHNAQDASAATTVEHALPLDFGVYDCSDSHLRGGMVARAESQASLYANGYVMRKRLHSVLCIIDDTFITHLNRVKSRLLPALIPVLVFDFRNIIGELNVPNWEVVEDLLH